MAIYLPNGTCYYSSCNEELVNELKDENISPVIQDKIQNPNWTFMNFIRPHKLVNVLKDVLGFSFSYPHMIFEEHRRKPYIEFLYKNKMEQVILFLITAGNNNQSCFNQESYRLALNCNYPLDKMKIDVRMSDEINLKEALSR